MSCHLLQLVGVRREAAEVVTAGRGHFVGRIPRCRDRRHGTPLPPFAESRRVTARIEAAARPGTIPVRSATTGSTAMGVRTASAAARVATWSVEVAIVVITVIGVTLEIADVKAQAEDPVHDREKCGEEGANMWKMVISCKVTNQERQGVLKLQHVAILSPMAAAAKEMPALLQVISQPIGEGVEGRSNANQIPLVNPFTLQCPLRATV